MRRRLKINRYCAGVRETCSKYTEESAEAAPGTSAPSRTHHHHPRSQKRPRAPSLAAGGPPAGLPGRKGPLPGLSHRLGAGCRRGTAPGSPRGRHHGHRCRAAGTQRPRPTGPRARRRGRPQPPGPHLLSAARRALLPRTSRRGAEGRRRRRRSELGGG